ncbi:MAG: pyruvate ferredoxin oxidoreductase [Candidatus Tectomicrobia bacterium]|uniref:Pyruvate ferredoxin oxidoreductase n=1 Tax=Tectimicrobiota bacterium TaxID=2528274 RepID=A0A932LZ75_UNCTE|nr:pyruvate ferredoxin oxidoreductase [Candidatus Tectomicrobia bacterium]
MESLKAGAQVIEGNTAAVIAAALARVQVIAAYPITPSSPIVESLSDLCAQGKLQARFIPVESEHSAMAACIGAAMTGCRTFTATSSQGLALMHELLHWSAGSRLPIVLVNVNRALAPPWTIFCDQSDAFSQRDTGWMQIYCETAQEVLDSVLQAYRISEEVLLPCMVNMDGFYLSHTAEPVEVPDPKEVDCFLPGFEPRFHLDAADPHAFGGGTAPAPYMEFRHQMQEAMEEAKDRIVRVGEEFGRQFGRSYGLLELYRAENASLLVVTSGSITGTAREAVDGLRDQGLAVGLLRVRFLRPFPAEEVRRAVSSAETLLVLDRAVSYGQGGTLAQEFKAALYGQDRLQIFSIVMGLGGAPVTRQMIEETTLMALERTLDPCRSHWLGGTI